MQNILAGRLLRKRGGAVVAAAAAAVLAAILLLIYLQSYRSSLKSDQRPERVLVATGLIPRGTSGDLVARQHLYTVASVQKAQIKALALADPASMNGSVAVADIYPGQQLTSADFTTQAETSIPYQITGSERAIAIPVDSSHGLIGQVAAGNFVDVYVGVGAGAGAASGAGASLRLLASNVLVLVAPGSAGSNAILRVSTLQAPKFAFAADNAQIWLVLRPQVGASPTPAVSATLQSLLSGGK